MDGKGSSAPKATKYQPANNTGISNAFEVLFMASAFNTNGTLLQASSLQHLDAVYRKMGRPEGCVQTAHGMCGPRRMNRAEMAAG